MNAFDTYNNAKMGQAPQGLGALLMHNLWQGGQPAMQQFQPGQPQMGNPFQQFNPVDEVNAKGANAIAVLQAMHGNNFAMPKGVEKNISGQVINPAASTNPWQNGFFKPQGSTANPFSWQMLASKAIGNPHTMQQIDQNVANISQQDQQAHGWNFPSAQIEQLLQHGVAPYQRGTNLLSGDYQGPGVYSDGQSPGTDMTKFMPVQQQHMPIPWPQRSSQFSF